MSIREFVAWLDDAGAPSAVASVVAFFPTSAEGLERELAQSLGVLIDAHPWFQCEAFVRFCPGRQPDLIGESKIACIFRRFDVKPGIVCKGWHRLWMPSRAKKARAFQKSPRHKTPLVRRDGQSRLTGSHYGNFPPSPDVLLTVAHFVFTAQFADKIARATAWGAHVNAAAKYRYYATLLEKMRGVENAFLDKGSRRYEGPPQLSDCGLMRW